MAIVEGKNSHLKTHDTLSKIKWKAWMKLDSVSVNATLNKAESLLKGEKRLSPAIRAMFEILILLIRALTSRLSVNSSNSSMPPTADKKRKRGSNREKSDKKPGGQNGHAGSRLESSEDPDEIINIKIDKTTLPKGKYLDAGYEARQVIDFIISKKVIEYRAQVLEDATSKKYVADFPHDVKTDVQYGHRVKAHAVYLSQFQFLPYARTQSYFEEKLKMSISTGSIFNFNKDAYLLLDQFEVKTKLKLLAEKVLNADETGINVNKKILWLHSVSNELWSYFYPHEKRGQEAMDEMGILPKFAGTLIHDHWKPYFTYSCHHGLCNAHHIRELNYAYEEDKQAWAADIKSLLLEINEAVNATENGSLPADKCEEYKNKYREIIKAGELESPLPPTPLMTQPKRRGRIKKTKSRNLLERLRDFEGHLYKLAFCSKTRRAASEQRSLHASK